MAIEDLHALKIEAFDRYFRKVHSQEYAALIKEMSDFADKNPVVRDYISTESQSSKDPKRVYEFGLAMLYMISESGDVPIVIADTFSASFICRYSDKRKEKEFSRIEDMLFGRDKRLKQIVSSLAKRSRAPNDVYRVCVGVCYLLGTQLESDRMKKEFNLEGLV